MTVPARQTPTGRIRVLGLLGAMGSGKSTVASLFAESGFRHLDADALAHDALEDPGIRARVVERFGAAVLDASGAVGRRLLADRVFAPGHGAELAALTRIVHPHVLARIEDGVRLARSGEGPPAVIDAPLLAETELLGLCDAVLFVDADPELCRRRLAARSGWNGQETERRAAHQMPAGEKRRLADRVIVNDGSLDTLRAEVRAVVQWIHGGGQKAGAAPAGDPREGGTPHG